MIDNFSLAVSHGLMLLVAWRLIFRRDLDKEAPPPPDPDSQGFRKGRPRNA
jgi:hypothetical protein